MEFIGSDLTTSRAFVSPVEVLRSSAPAGGAAPHRFLANIGGKYVPDWVIIVSCIGAVLVILLIVVLICLVFRSRKKKKERKKFQEDVFDYEKQRAHKMLIQLKKMNQQQEQQDAYYTGPPAAPPPYYQEPPPMCCHGAACPTACQMCYPPAVSHVAAMGPVLGMAPLPAMEMPPYPAYARRASSYDEYRREYDDYSDDPGYDEHGYESQDSEVPRMRRAESASEMPTSPPPVAPPGFRAVPMVIEERRRH